MNNTISVYELLGLIKDGKIKEKTYIKYYNREYEDKETMYVFLSNILYKLETKEIELNDKVEIINCEEWKQIVGFPNYEISTKGNIRTKERLNNKNDIKKSKLLSKRKNNVGYEYVILSNKTQKHKTLTVHRLMAKTFLNNYSDNLEVNHINGIKDDNRIENLEMTTHSENVKKRYEIGNIGNNYKAVNQYDLNNNYIATYKSSYDAEKVTGIGRTCIGGCCRKEHHTAGGYIWKFVEEDKPIIEKIKRHEFKENGITISGQPSIIEIADKLNQVIDYINRKEDK